MSGRPPSLTLFPYTTLFRSSQVSPKRAAGASVVDDSIRAAPVTEDEKLLQQPGPRVDFTRTDRKSTRLNSSHLGISYAVFCLKKKNKKNTPYTTRNRQRQAT